MKISDSTINEFRDFFNENSDDVTELINLSRAKLGDIFNEDVELVGKDDVEDEFLYIMENRDLALNLSALYRIGVDLEVNNDYAGFIVDEIIGRQIASTIAQTEPEKTLSEATFHYIDIHTHQVLEEGTAGSDDVMAGIAAGLETRLPGWDWQKEGR